LRRIGFNPRAVRMDVWWTKWHRDRFAPRTVVFRCQYHPTISPYLVIFHLEMDECLTKSDTSRRQVSPPPPLPQQQQQQQVLNDLYCYFSSYDDYYE